MPIKNFVSGDVPFLQSYNPFTIGEGVQVVDDIADMVSYNIQPTTESSVVEYYTATTTPYREALLIKNVTRDAIIEITIIFNNNAFIVYEQGSFIDTVKELKFNLQPEQTRTFIIETKNTKLDSMSPYSQFQTDIEFRFKNIDNGNLVSKRISSSALSSRLFPKTVTIR